MLVGMRLLRMPSLGWLSYGSEGRGARGVGANWGKERGTSGTKPRGGCRTKRCSGKAQPGEGGTPQPE